MFPRKATMRRARAFILCKPRTMHEKRQETRRIGKAVKSGRNSVKGEARNDETLQETAGMSPALSASLLTSGEGDRTALSLHF
jgi:hypothetical protein